MFAVTVEKIEFLQSGTAYLGLSTLPTVPPHPTPPTPGQQVGLHICRAFIWCFYGGW